MVVTDPPRAMLVPVREPTPARRPYAGFVTRTIAFAIDAAIINGVALIVAAVAALVLSVFPISNDTKTALAVVGGGLWVVWLVGYFLVFWSTSGETPGSHVMRIRVVSVRGDKIRPRRALLRLAGLVAGLPLFLGYLPILLTDRRRGLQDVLGGTVVINQPPDAHATQARGTVP
jgi:uncharacterized RDD family membrane protein YckC